jgi:ribonuclease HII
MLCEGFTLDPMPRFDLSLLPNEPDLSFELPLWEAGLTAVAGIDEAGRGALAGPVAAGAVILPPKCEIIGRLMGVRDSKQMTPDEREAGREKILRYAVSCGVGFATAAEIDQLGILPATRLAACRAFQTLTPAPAHLLLDYLFLPDVALPQTALIKGDCRSLSIAAASVLAKTARDALLRELELIYPGYGFAAHKGYGTRAHREALHRLGVSPVHRLSFALFGESKYPLNDNQQEI